MKTSELEIIIAKHFGVRTHLIVPNVFWGWGLNYEADLVVVTRSRCAYEIELKVSRSDLKADAKKKRHHNGEMFKGLWFAMPLSVYDESLIPERAGVLIVKNTSWHNWKTGKKEEGIEVEVKRKPKTRNVKITEKQYVKLLELAAMRIWKLKGLK